MKNNKIVNLAYLLSTIIIPLVIACGGSQTATTSGTVQIRKIGGLEYGVVSGNVESTESSVSGTGTLVFRNQLPEEDNRFTFTVGLQKKGSVTFTTNTDPQLKSGIQLSIRRDDSDRLIAEMKDGVVVEDLSSFFSGFNGSQPFSFQLEVHPHGHLILVNGGREEEFDFRARPTGKFWGVSLVEATLSSVSILSVEGE